MWSVVEMSGWEAGIIGENGGFGGILAGGGVLLLIIDAASGRDREANTTPLPPLLRGN